MAGPHPLHDATPAIRRADEWPPVAPPEILALGPAASVPGPWLDDQIARTVSDGEPFRRLLRSSRPLVAVVFAPPATPSDIAAVAHERRCRHDLRAVLVDQPDAGGERLAALRAGFDQALDARVTAAELSGRVALLAEEARRVRSDRLINIAPHLVLDVVAHELRLSGRTVHLRPREYAMLEVLARHPGQTFTRRQLLQAVGAPETIGDARTVDVHIRWLREKLTGHDAVSVQLITVRNVGYRLDTVAPSAVAGDAVNRTLTNGEQDVDGAAQD